MIKLADIIVTFIVERKAVGGIQALHGCGKLDPTTSRGRTSLTPNELNIELSCFLILKVVLKET